mgnify:CR=1 FL=1
MSRTPCLKLGDVAIKMKKIITIINAKANGGMYIGKLPFFLLISRQYEAWGRLLFKPFSRFWSLAHKGTRPELAHFLYEGSKPNFLYAHPAAARGTATSIGSGQINLPSGVRTYNTALCGFAVASGNLSDCYDLSFAGGTT